MKKLPKTMTVAAVFGAAFCGHGETVTFSSHASDPDNIITNDVHYSKPISAITTDDQVRYWGENSNLMVNVPDGVSFASAFTPYFFAEWKNEVSHKVLVTLTGSGEWYQPDLETAYAGTQFHVQNSGSVFSLARNASYSKKGGFRLSNGTLELVKWKDEVVESAFNFDCDANFYDPNGTALSDNIIYIFNSNLLLSN